MQTDTGRDRPATGRLSLVLELLLDALPSITAAGRRPRVLDCGGGSGTFAVPLARAGADVTVVDISADALATLARRAEEAGVSDAVRGVAGDVESLADALAAPDSAAGQYDMVLAHGVLDAVDAVGNAFGAIAASVRPGGLLSLLVTNPDAAVIARALAGDLRLALVELRELGDPAEPGDDPANDAAEAAPALSATPTLVQQLCRQQGLVVEVRHGIGAFSDIVPGAALDSPAARELLAQLDREAADREQFAALAGRIHVLARRPLR